MIEFCYTLWEVKHRKHRNILIIINKQFCITKLFSLLRAYIKSVQVCRISILADLGNPISKPQQIWHMITLKHNKDRFKLKHSNIRSLILKNKICRRISIECRVSDSLVHSLMGFLLMFPFLFPLFRLPLHICLLSHFSSSLTTLKRQQIGSVRRGQTVRFVFSDCYLPCHLMYIPRVRWIRLRLSNTCYQNRLQQHESSLLSSVEIVSL